MKNFVQPGDTVTLIAPSGGVVSGSAVKVGVIIGVAAVTAAEGAEFEAKRTGVFTHAAATSQAWTLGAKLYWDDTNKVFTTTASGNTAAGAAAAAKDSAAATGSVLLIPIG